MISVLFRQSLRQYLLRFSFLRLFLAVAVFCSGSLSLAQYEIGHVISKGEDCGVVDVQKAYFIKDGGAKVLKILLSVLDLDYNKEIVIDQGTWHADGGTASWTSPSYESFVSAKFEDKVDGKSGSRDLISVRDNRVGPEDETTANISVTMNGQVYRCSSVVIGM